LSPSAFQATTTVAAKRLDRLLAGDGTLVTTGQQPVLFLGPLYVLYKALTAVAHARRIEAATGRPALAAFWIAADDHDWQEVATAQAVDLEGNLVRFAVPPPPERAGRAVGPTPLPREVEDVREEYVRLLGRTEFAGEALRPLVEAYRPGASFAEAFSRALGALLFEHPLVLLDASGLELKRASVPLLGRCLEDAEGCAEAFARGSARVLAAGHEPRLHPPSGGTQVFYEGERREHIVRHADGRLGPRGGPTEPLGVWLERLEAEPDRFSAGAALRPVLESWLLPVARTVLGPGEIEYWAQLPPLFERLGVPVPEVAPRASWRVVEPRVDRWLGRIGAEATDLSDGGASVVSRLVAEGRPKAVGQALESLRGSLEDGFAGLEERTEEELPGLRAAVGKARKGALDAVSGLETTIDARVRERREILVSHAGRAAALLYPGGRPQERVVGPWSFLARYGPSFLRSLAGAHGLAREAQSVAAPGGAA
jgi:bacillithiol biosynthesis cysteine-adding enzyme BshC